MSSHQSNKFLRLVRDRWKVLLLGSIIVGQGLFGFLVGILLFYRGGIYFLDAGYYIYTLASENFGQQPPAVGSSWGSSLYATHMLLTPLSISQIFRLVASAPMNFIMFLGLQHLILATAGALLMMVSFSLNGVRREKLLIPGMVGALLLPFSNIGLGSLLYPHVELIGTSLIAIGILTLALYWSGHNRRWLVTIAAIAIVLGLLSREDIGVHLIITVGSALICSQWKRLGRSGLVRAGTLLLAGVLFTGALMAYQRIFADSHGVFALTYSGTPAYAHITSIWYLLDRVLFLLSSRLDLIVGLSAFVVAAIILRKREYLAFPVAVAPWLILNLTAIDPAKNAMGIYHLFPIILYATAPILALVLTKHEEQNPDSVARGHVPVCATYGIAVVSLFLGGVSMPPTGGGYLFTSVLRLPLISPAGINATNLAIENFAKLDVGIAVDDAVMAIKPVDLQNVPLIPTVQDSTSISAIMFYPRYLLGHVGVRNLFNLWITENRRITTMCLPGGLVRVDAAKVQTKPTLQTADGQLEKALKCHPLPSR